MRSDFFYTVTEQAIVIKQRPQAIFFQPHITQESTPPDVLGRTQFRLEHPHEADMSPVIPCPRCHSAKITTHNYARMTGGAVGTVAGAAGSAAAAFGGAKTGAVVGMVAGPPGALLGGLAGALIGALVGGAAGCAAGAAVGEHIDDTVLDNYECEECGHIFGKRHIL